MKIWMLENSSLKHKIIRLNCEEHSEFSYLGDLNDEEIKEFFVSLQDDIDVEKNLKLLKYYGYLHLFIIAKKRSDS